MIEPVAAFPRSLTYPLCKARFRTMPVFAPRYLDTGFGNDTLPMVVESAHLCSITLGLLDAPTFDLRNSSAVTRDR